MESLLSRLQPWIDRFGLVGLIMLSTLLVVVVSLTLTLTVMNLSGVEESAGVWIKLAMFFPLLATPPVTYLLLKLIDELNQAKNALQVTEAEVKIIGRLVPVCSCCKKVRDDEVYWNELADYRANHSDGDLPHGICPVCKDEQYQAFLNEQGED